MKKASALILVFFTAVTVLCTVAFYISSNRGSGILHIRTPEPSSQSAVDGSVNINTADLEELMTLPGIGQTLALRIIDYRNAHGSFRCVAELLQVEGIGAGKLDAILDLITTGGTT